MEGLNKFLTASEGGEAEPLMPSGVYPACVTKVEIGDSEAVKGKAKWTIYFQVTWDKAPNPLFKKVDVRRVLDFGKAPMVKVPEGMVSALGAGEINGATLYLAYLFGAPSQTTSGVKWGEGGFVKWNGQTNDGAKFAGDVELLIESKEGNLKNDGRSHWPHRYYVNDVLPVGASKVMEMEDRNRAQAAMMSLFKGPAPVTETIASAPPPPATVPRAPGKGSKGPRKRK